MTKKKLTVMGSALALGAAAAVALPMTSANAYPPGTKLTLSAKQGSDPTHFLVNVANGRPFCQLKLSVHGRDVYQKLDATGAYSGEILVGPISGPYTIHAQVYGFQHGGHGCNPVENAVAKVVVTKYKLLGPKTVRAGDKFPLQATGWLPGVGITFTISDGTTMLTFPTTAGPDGRVTHTVSVPHAGVWAVVVTQVGGPTTSYSLQVTPGHKTPDAGHGHKPPKPTPKPKPTHHHHKHHPVVSTPHHHKPGTH